MPSLFLTRKLFSSAGSHSTQTLLFSLWPNPKTRAWVDVQIGLSRHSWGVILESAWSVFLAGVETGEPRPLGWWSSERLGWVSAAVLLWVQIEVSLIWFWVLIWFYLVLGLGHDLVGSTRRVDHDVWRSDTFHEVGIWACFDVKEREDTAVDGAVRSAESIGDSEKGGDRDPGLP